MKNFECWAFCSDLETKHYLVSEFPLEPDLHFSVRLCPMPVCNLLAGEDKEGMFLPNN